MHTWPIGKRILLLVVLLLALLLTLGAISYSLTLRMRRHAREDLVNRALPANIEISNLVLLTVRGQVRVLMAGNATTPAGINTNLVEIRSLQKQEDEALARYRALLGDDSTEAGELETITSLQSGYRNAIERYLTLVRAADTQGADAFLSSQLEPAYFAFRERLKQRLENNQAFTLSTGRDIASLADNSLRQVLFLALASLLVAGLIGWLVIRSIHRSLHVLAHALQETAAQVNGTAGQVSGSSTLLAKGASEQAAALEETSASLEEIASMSGRNTEGAGNALTYARESDEATKDGALQIRSLVDAMKRIDEASADIGHIIKTIDEIAFQTNLLALNAAVEAARSTASKIEDSLQRSRTGLLASTKASQSLDSITAKVELVSGLVGEVAASSREQLQGISQIKDAVSQMDRVTQDAAAGAEETATAASQLREQAARLLINVDQLLRLMGESRLAGNPTSP